AILHLASLGAEPVAHEGVIGFDGWGADDVRARTWHASQELVDRPDGRLVVKMTLNNLEEVEKWVFGFGEHATVIGPPELGECIARIGKGLALKYGRCAAQAA